MFRLAIFEFGEPFMKQRNKKVVMTFISMILALAVFVPVSAIPAAADVIQCGDIDRNGKLDSADVILILRFSIGLEEFTVDQVEFADVNGDGIVNSNDAVAVLRSSIGLEELGFREEPDEDNDSDDDFINRADPFAVEVLRLVNIEREREELEPLVLDETLCNISTVRANEIRQVFSHSRPDGSSWVTLLDEYNAPYFSAGENIAAGYVSPQDVVEAWMNSEGHRKNIMSPKYGKMGLSYAYFQDDIYHYYWDQIF